MFEICDLFITCGGCRHQNIPYSEELALKRETVLSLLRDAGVGGFEFLGIEGAASTEGYRNKMEFSFGDEGKGSELALGMRKRGSFYEVVTSDRCRIVDADFRRILSAVLNFFRDSGETFYHKRRHTGALRHLIVRKGKNTGEILVNLVAAGSLMTDLRPLAEILRALPLDGSLVGFLRTVNDSVADAVKCDGMEILFGRDYFYEKLLGLTFKISPFSFFQTNSDGAARLYTTAREFAGETRGQNIFDLYCGTGTIAQILSPSAKSVTGVELVAEAADAARENAGLNKIENCRFIAGDVLKVLDELEQKPDIIVLDPPREGLNPKALAKIIAYGAPTVVYISCKPASLARDAKVFEENGYRLEKLKCHDLFPRTAHIESVALIKKKTGVFP